MQYCQNVKKRGVRGNRASGRREPHLPRASAKCRKPLLHNGLQSTRRLSAALLTLPITEPDAVTRCVLDVPQRGIREAPVATDRQGRDRAMTNRAKSTMAGERAFAAADGRLTVWKRNSRLPSPSCASCSTLACASGSMSTATVRCCRIRRPVRAHSGWRLRPALVRGQARPLDAD